MKKFKRLLRLKGKKSHDAQYNAFEESSGYETNSIGNGAATTSTHAATASTLAPVHKPTKTKTKSSAAKSKSKSKSKRMTQATTPATPPPTPTATHNRIDYAAWQCERNGRAQQQQQQQQQQRPRRRPHTRCGKWWRRWCFGGCGGTRTPTAGGSRARRSHKPSTGGSKRQCTCCCCAWSGGWHWRIGCCRQPRYRRDADEDDDIDGKVAAYLLELQERQAANTATTTPTGIATTANVGAQVESTRTQQQHPEHIELNDLRSGTPTDTIAAVSGSTAAPLQSQSSQSLAAFRRCPSKAQTAAKRRAWTWDDSLRSNSDRFLETLEEDELNAARSSDGNSSTSNTRRPALQRPAELAGDVLAVTLRVGGTGEEAKAAAEELSRSPVMGQRNEASAAVASPIHSRGSGSSENWPAQSDEDIDRLVAMHQNRSSLSSLGLRSDSMASVYSGAGEGRYGTVVVKGQVEFGMQYNYKLGALEIHVVRCKDLAAVDAKRNRSDPYVKVYLLPDKSKAGKRKTKVKKHTLNPIFDEVLRFQIPVSSLETRTLWLTVWHSDMFGRNDFLGEVSVQLLGRVFDNPQSQWYTLQERSEPFDEVATYRGDIVVGLKYVPPESSHSYRASFTRSNTTAGAGGSNLRKFGSIKSVTSKSDRTAKGGQLHVLVKEAKNLSPIKPNGTCDAFCKSYLLPDRTRSSKQKTLVVKRSLHPTWNYTFVYEDVTIEDLSERALELTVWDHDRLASNEFLGGIRFSLGTGKSYGRHVDFMDATGKELSLWQNMIDRPNFWVEGSVVLRPSLDGLRSIP